MAAKKSADQTKFAKDQLKAFVERIERLEEEKKTIGDDIKDVFGEADGAGFNKKALRKVIKMRAQDPDERKTEQHISRCLHARAGHRRMGEPIAFEGANGILGAPAGADNAGGNRPQPARLHFGLHG